MLLLMMMMMMMMTVKCEEEAMLSAVTVNDKYLAQLEEDDVPHFIFFHVTWSKFCLRVAPVWEKIADHFNNMQNQE